MLRSHNRVNGISRSSRREQFFNQNRAGQVARGIVHRQNRQSGQRGNAATAHFGIAHARLPPYFSRCDALVTLAIMVPPLPGEFLVG